MAEQNAYEKFTQKEWALALMGLMGLTPSGSEFLTPDECTSYVRRRLNYPRIIIELREENATLRRLLGVALEDYDDENCVSRANTIREALAKAAR
jgi:hypothetical protein